MQTATIRSVDATERSRAMSIQVMAFAADPVLRWIWPEPGDYLAHFPHIAQGFGGRAFDHDAAHVSEDFQGGALWLPPNVLPDEDALEVVIRDRVPEAIGTTLGHIFEQMAESAPSTPHWHLAFIGVDPFWHGQGIGAALLRHGLAKVDEAGEIAYLESTNPRNISLYERHGFSVIREIRVGDAPPLFPMVRPARRVIL